MTGSNRSPQRVVWLVLAGLSLLLACRYAWLAHEYSVNLLFWDQWDFYEPMFNGASLWEVFRHLHGPHRQGLGGLIITATSWLSGWNSRWDVFVIVTIQILCLPLTLLLKARLAGSATWSDIAYPLLLLNTAQWEVFGRAPNVAHGVLPLFLLLLAALAWSLHDDRKRLAALGILLPLTAFTGFGVLALPLAPMLAALWMISLSRTRDWRFLVLPSCYLTVWIGTAWLFLEDYPLDRLSPPPGGEVSDPHLGRYLHFMVNLAGWPTGDTRPDSPALMFVGASLLALTLVAAGSRLRRFSKGSPAEKSSALALLQLLGFGLAFVAACAAGRTARGLQFSTSSRYVPLTLPLWLGVILWLQTGRQRAGKKALLIVLCAFLLVEGVSMSPSHRRELVGSHARRTAWKHSYLIHCDIARADREAHEPIHPVPEGIHLEEKLRFLRERRLNLFLDAPSPKGGAQASD